MTRRPLKISALHALLLLTLLAAALPARAATYYIDYASGSNSNAGTSKSSPWKTHPYMQSVSTCTGTGSAPAYTHAAGDQFIFKGGVTWPLACFRMLISQGGASGSPDYYGVDKTWYTGGSWTRPLFDMANGTPTGGQGNILKISAAWVVVDNIEMKRNLIVAYASDCADATIDASGGGHVTIENSYIHDWTITAFGSTGPGVASTSHSTGSICQTSTSDVNAIGNTITDLNTTAAVPFGACFRSLNNVENNDCEHVGEGEVGHFGNTDGNIFANINGVAVQNKEGTWPNHTNILEASGALVGDGPIFNNLLYNNYAGVSIFDCNQANIYNNVIWLNQNNYAIELDINCPGATSSTVANIYNNTVDCSNNGNECFEIFYRSSGDVPGILNLRNNHWIANGTAACYANAPTCGAIAGGTQSNNVTMSSAAATTQGYTSSNKYAPTSGSGATVTAGANLTSQCTGALAALCEDATGTPWKGGSFITRPTGSTAWDAGAYEFQSGGGGGGSGPPTISISAPANGAAVSGTISLTSTCTPQGTATVSSIQYSIDGNNFGAPGTSSPYTLSWNTLTAANGSHTINAVCTDSNSQTGTAGAITVTVSNSMPGCFVSGSNTNWNTYQSFTAQTTNFIATFTATPNTANQDSVIALSQAPMSAYAQGAALVRFNSTGQIDAYKGSLGNYTADATVNYTAGATYAFTFTVDMTAGTYSVALTSPTSVTIATGYTFRITASAASLGYINAASDNTTPDTAQVCNFQIGSAASLTFSPASVNFGNITVGANSTQTITATTVGGTVNFSSVAISGNADFTIASNTCTASVPSSCATQIQFSPTSAALETATLTYTDDATGSPQSVAISGTGVPATPTLSVSPTSLNFGGVHVHATSSSGPIVLTISSGPVTFTGTPSLSGPNAADFALASNTCTGVVSASSCQSVVSFTPSLVAAESATLTYTDNATGSPQSVSLTGTGYLAPHPPTAVQATVE